MELKSSYPRRSYSGRAFKSHLYGIEINKRPPFRPDPERLNRTFMELKLAILPRQRASVMFKSHLYGIEIGYGMALQTRELV